ncbi:hypothetical protein D9619_011687 [Psilocybe cf. subviscida]|uniref:DUF6535 domain-containing protein n=1 Tax=Psilocybe cf. subviscida TaxID=2480587 RepID=A0A8H5BT47_9AGAR|nr:hypothetical protein D9619_011687 [Psilocybe cf. subviscida]
MFFASPLSPLPLEVPIELNRLPISPRHDASSSYLQHRNPRNASVGVVSAFHEQSNDIYSETTENSAVWALYNEETTKADASMQDASNRGIDVLLVFTGLFSAVLTTFIILVYQLLMPGPSDYANALLAILLVSKNITLPPSPSSSISPTTEELKWVSGLWFVALAFSLSAALFCMLAKQWLQFSPVISGSLRHRARQRQRMYLQFQTWHVLTVIHALPILLHATLLLFFGGLIVMLWGGSVPVTVVTFIIVAVVYACYFGSMWLSLLNPDCPYQHPISEQMRFWKDKAKKRSQKDVEQGLLITNLYKIEEPDAVPDQVHRNDELDASSLIWLLEHCPNGSSPKLAALQAIGGLPLSFTAFHILRNGDAIPQVLGEFKNCFHKDSTLDSHWYVLDADNAEAYCRSWMRLTNGTSKKWPSSFYVLLDTLISASVSDNVRAIASCTLAVARAESDNKDGRLAILSHLERYIVGSADISIGVQQWLLDSFLRCSLVSQLQFRPKDYIQKEAVPVMLGLLQLTKHAMASNARSAIALSLSYITGNMDDCKLIWNEEERRNQFYRLIIPAFSAIIEASEDGIYGVDHLWEVITDEFCRLVSLALTPTDTNAPERRKLRPIAQRGLLKLFVQGHIKKVPIDILEDIITTLYPADKLLKKTDYPQFVSNLLECLGSSVESRTLIAPGLRLLEPILEDASPTVIDAFVAGDGLRILTYAAQTGDTSSRRLQLDCMRNLCLFIGGAADYCVSPESLPSTALNTVGNTKDAILDYIFQFDAFFQTLHSMVSSRRWWLPEIVEVWVPELLKLCRLRPRETGWLSLHAALEKFSGRNEGKDGHDRLFRDLSEMKSLLSPSRTSTIVVD